MREMSRATCPSSLKAEKGRKHLLKYSSNSSYCMFCLSANPHYYMDQNCNLSVSFQYLSFILEAEKRKGREREGERERERKD